MICCMMIHYQQIRLFLITRNSIKQHFSHISQGQGYQNVTVGTNSTKLIDYVSTASKVCIHLIHKVTINVFPAIPMLVVQVDSNQLSTKDIGEAQSIVTKSKSAVATHNTAKPLLKIHNPTPVSQATLVHYAKHVITQQCIFQMVILIAHSAKTAG